MQIAERPSPSFNDRKRAVSLLVLHYTGMDDAEAAISRLCDPDAGVSAHYVVAEDGAVSRLVPEDRRAWHAGAGDWRGEGDVNSASIGIEIVNGGHCYGLPAFPDVQIAAVAALSKAIMARHAIKPSGVIAHSDLAPERKLDPGASPGGVWRRRASASGPPASPATAPCATGRAAAPARRSPACRRACAPSAMASRATASTPRAQAPSSPPFSVASAPPLWTG